MQFFLQVLKTLLALFVALNFSACTPKDGVQPVELDKAFTTRVGQSHISPDEDFTFRITKIIADIRNDAASIVEVELEYAAISTNGLTEHKTLRAHRTDYFGPYAFQIVEVRPGHGSSKPEDYRFKVEVSRNNFLSVDCSYFHMRTEVDEVLNHTDCGTLDNWGLIRINRATLDTIDFDQPATEGRPARLWCLPMKLSNGDRFLAYLNEDGLGRESIDHHDPKCGWFSKTGLAMTHVKGHVYFFDQQMNIKRATHYVLIEGDIGCSQMPEKYYPVGDEHFEWRGGACSRIDQNFIAKGAAKYSFEDVPL